MVVQIVISHSNDHSHKDQKDYKCDLCDNSFSTAGDMMSHTVSVHETTMITNVYHVVNNLLTKYH